MSDSDTPLASGPAVRASRVRQARRLRWLWLVLLITPLVAGASLLGVSAVLFGTESGSQWLITQISARSGSVLNVEAPRGSFWRGLSAKRLRWSDPQFSAQAHSATITVHWASLLQGRLLIPEIRAKALEISIATSDRPPRLPASLALPLGWSIGQLRIDSLRLHQEGKSPLELEGISLSASYAGGRYRLDTGSARGDQIALTQLTLELGDVAPFAVRASAQLHLEPARSMLIDPAIRARLAPGALTAPIQVEGRLAALELAARIDYQGAQLQIDTGLKPFEEEPLSALRVRFDGLEPARLIKGLAAARLSGSVTVSPARDRVDFALTNSAVGVIEDDRVPVMQASGRAHISTDHIAIDDLRVQLPGDARIHAALTVYRNTSVRQLGWDLPRLKARAQLRGVSLRKLAKAWPDVHLTGDLALTDDRIEIDLSRVLPAETLTLKGAMRLHSDRIDVERLQADMPLGVLEVSAGQVAIVAPYVFDLTGTVAQLDPVRVLERWSIKTPPHAAGLLEARWRVQGRASAQAAQLKGMLDLRPVSYAGQPLRGKIDFELSGKTGAQAPRIAVQGDLDWGGNRVAATGSLGRAGDRLRVDLNLQRPGVLDRRAGGTLSANAVMVGALTRPALTLQAQAPELVWEDSLAIKGLAVSLEVTDPRRVVEQLRETEPSAPTPVQADTLALRIAIQELRSGGQILQALALSAMGTSAQHTFEGSLRWVGHSLAIGGSAQVREGSWRAVVSALRAQGIFSASLRGQAEITAGIDQAKLSGLTLVAEGGTIGIEEAFWSPRALRLAGEARAVSLRPLIDWLERETAPSAGQEDRRFARPGATAGKLPDPRIEAGERVRRLRLDASWALAGASSRQLDGRLAAALRPETESGVAAQDVVLGANRIDLKLSGGEIDGLAELAIPSLRFSQRYTAPDWSLDGALFFSGQVRGRLDAPELRGALRAERLSLFNRSLGWRLRDGEIDARFEGRDLVLNTLRFASGDGMITMAGKLRMTDAPPGGRVAATNALPLEGLLSLDARRLPVPLGPGQRLLFSGITEIVAQGAELAWRGRLRADEGLIELRSAGVPDLPADVRISGEVREAPVKADASSVAGWAPRVQVDLAVELGERLRVRGGGVDARLGGELTLSGALPSAPRVRGTVEVREGTFSAYSRQLSITRGLIRFTGDIDNPVLDIVAMRRNQPVEAGVAMTGSALSPRIRLVSEPDLPDAQKLSWLVLGSSLDDVTNAGQARALGEAAFTLLGRDDESLIATLTQRLGIDAVSLGASRSGARDELGTARLGPPPLAGANASAAAAAASGLARQEVVTVSKRLSSRLTLSYERGISGLWNLVRLQYDISNRLSLRAQSGSENALDLLYFWWFD